MSPQLTKILGFIAGITPQRHYSPPSIKAIETVKWREALSEWAQNPGYQILVDALMSYNAKLRFLFPRSDEERLKTCRYAGEAELLQRSQALWAQLYATTVFAYVNPKAAVLDYRARDDEASEGLEEAFSILQLVVTWPDKYACDSDLWKCIEKLGRVGGFGQQFPDASLTSLLTLKFKALWGSVLNKCATATKARDRFLLAFEMATIVFGQPTLEGAIRTLLAFAFSARLKRLARPMCSEYLVFKGISPIDDQITKCIERNVIPGHDVQGYLGDYDGDLKTQRRLCLLRVCGRFPSVTPALPRASQVPLIDLVGLHNCLKDKWALWYDNHNLHTFVAAAEVELAAMQAQSVTRPRPNLSTSSAPTPAPRQILVDTLPSIMNTRTSIRWVNNDCLPELLAKYVRRLEPIESRNLTETLSTGELRKTIDAVRKQHPELPQYADELDSSLDEFLSMSKRSLIESDLQGQQRMVEMLACRNKLKDHLSSFVIQCAKATDPLLWHERLRCSAGQWPKVSTLTLLRCLAVSRRLHIPQSWLHNVTCYGQAVTELQKLDRMLRFVVENKQVELHAECANPGHQNWSPLSHPDWLLLEIENDILIREIQVKVARAMIQSDSTDNSLLQLEMGQGKSSTICPMLLAVLSDGQQLARLYTLRHLLPETLSNLSKCLGGLVERRIVWLPFSRSTRLTCPNVGVVERALRDALRDHSVLLTTPEWALSFLLLGDEKLASNDVALGQRLLDLRQWTDGNVRNVLDESDSILDVNFEQVYTLGQPVKLDGAPQRWTIPQQLYDLVHTFARQIRLFHPMGVEYTERANGAFHSFRLLEKEAGDALIKLLADTIEKRSVVGLNISQYSEEMRDAVRTFIEDRRLPEETDRKVQREFEGDDLAKLFLLRGLLAHRMLLVPFENRRYSVNYGLSLDRCLHAVPYKARNYPSPAADFAHPDVLVTTTIISWYYHGLEEEQLRKCLFAMLDSPGRAEIWTSWSEASRIPREYRRIKNINMDDHNCRTVLSDHLRSCKIVIDYFMNMFVFTKVEEYQWKLQRSAADLLQMQPAKPTTGFSGTMDNKCLLPIAIKQRNLKELAHTDAEVLLRLLEKNNRNYVYAHNNDERLSTEDLLACIVAMHPKVSVLIDSGAQVLDKSNQETAITWLHQAEYKSAAIYFDDDNEKMVIDRDGNVECFNSSRFKDSIQDCLLYLDHMHCRGCDFKLPDDFRAALTLGPKLTRDSFVQAALRMRKLGKGQTFCTIIPPEIHFKIRDMFNVAKEMLDVSHAIQWVLGQTCTAIVNSKPLHVLRCINHAHRVHVTSHYLERRKEEGAAEAYVSSIREREAFTVQELYEETFHGSGKLCTSNLSDEEKRKPELQELLLQHGLMAQCDNLEAEVEIEQEKEIAKEAEKEKESVRPPSFEPETPTVSPILYDLVISGHFDESKFEPAFNAFKKTSAGAFMEAGAWERALFATQDFTNTIKESSTTYQDYSLKPVNFILSFQWSQCLLIISQNEADSIIPTVRRSQYTMLHVYTPRVSRTMESYDELDFFAITASMEEPTPFKEAQALLNLFSGQLFFANREKYHTCCDFAGVLYKGKTLRTFHKPYFDSGRFVAKKLRLSKHWHESPFEKNPLKFIQEVTNLRRKGEDWSKSTMGKIVNGEEPTEQELGSSE